VPFSTAAVIQSDTSRGEPHAASLLGAPPEAAFDRLTNLAIRLLHVPIALVSLVDTERRGRGDDPAARDSWTSSCEIPVTHPLCLTVVATRAPYVIDDVREHPFVFENPALREFGIKAYAGVPLITSTGEVLGSFCAVDRKPRRWSDEELDTLRDLAAAAVTEVEFRNAARALAEQEARQSALLDHTTEMICAVDLEGRITYVNMAWQKAFGYGADEARELVSADLVVPGGRDAFHAYESALRDGQTAEFAAVLLSKDGRRIVCQGQGWPQREHGVLIGAYAVYRDVTEHSRSEHVRERLVTTLEASPDFVSIVTTDGRLVFLNQAARRLIGLDDDTDASTIELSSLRSSVEARRMIDEIIPCALRDGMCRADSTLVDAHGRPVPVSQTVIAHRSTHPDKPPYFISVVARDLRERVTAEHEQRQSEERFRAAMEASQDAFFVMEPVRRDDGSIRDFRIADVNRRACEMLARPRQSVVGEMVTSTFASARLKLPELIRVVETGVAAEEELPVTTPGITATWLHVQVVRVGDGLGITSRDISSRKAAEAALERDRAFYAAMLEHLSEGIVACDANGDVTLFNRATRELHGITRGPAAASDLDPSVLREADGVTVMARHNTPLMRALRGEPVINQEVMVTPKAAPARALLASGRQFFDSDGRLLGAVVASRDVTTHKVVERALRDSEERFRSVVESLGEGVFITDMEGATIYANEKIRGITGYEASELIGRNPRNFLVKAEYRQSFDEHLEERGRGIAGRYTMEFVRKDGTIVWVEISGVPYRDGTGKVVGTVGSVTDISDRRRWEAALLEAKEEAERANRAKSAFLSRASHELRTPLNSVIGFSGVLLKNRTGILNESDLSYIQRIRVNGGHLLSLVNDILDIAKVEAGRMSVDLSTISPSELVHEVVSSLEGRVLEKRTLSLSAFASSNLEPILTDAPKLRQILTNLIGNAIKFTKSGTVTVSVIEDDTNHPASIVVEDTGCGIAEHELQRIFEAFEQADSAHNSAEAGTGLGLAIAKSFCDLLGYTLRVESELGRGTRFIVDL
jgi:PAS domain S-box-containing protein